MVLIKGYERELRITKSILNVGKRRDVSETKTGKLLRSRGLISKKTGRTTVKGKKLLRYL